MSSINLINNQETKSPVKNQETKQDPQASPSPSKKTSFITFTFTSPLSKETVVTRKRKYAQITNSEDSSERPTKIRKNLFAAFESTVCVAKDLQNLYGIDFEHPPAKANKTSFFELRDQLLLIENLPNTTDADIQAKIKEIVNNQSLSHEEKMAELGAIFYFLERYDAVPDIEEKGSYTKLRALEILEEIQRLKDHLDPICKSKKVSFPSGKTQYILRALTLMVLSQQQKLNVGGLYTIQQILNSSSSGLVCHLSPEHRDHILVVLKNLLSKPQFKALLERKVDVHADMADLIRLDLKLPRTEPVSSSHVMWACVMALFFDTRQVHHSNCAAIAVLIYATQNATYKVLTKMIDWLTTGHFGYKDSITIPIYPLIEHRLVYEKDLQVKLEPKSALALTTVEKIADLSGISPEQTNVQNTSETTLQTTLTELFQDSSSEEAAVYALQTYYFFKRDAVNEMVLMMLEFYDSNFDTNEKANATFSVEKNQFISLLMQPLKQTSQKFKKILKERLSQKIWMQNCNDLNVTQKEDRLIVGPQHARYEITDFDGDLDALKKILDEAQRIFILENGEYRLLKRISDLQNEVKNIASEIAKELNYKDATKNRTLSVISSKNYLNTIADFCANQIEKEGIIGITSEALQQSDLLLLSQKGILGLNCLDFLGLKYDFQEWEQKTPLNCVEQFFKAFKNIDPSMLESTPLFYIGTDTHSFTISPKKCSLIWKDHEQFQKFLKETILADNYLKQPIPPAVAESIIERIKKQRLAENKKIAPLLKTKKNLSYNEFRRILMSKVAADNHKKLKIIIDQEYYKVALSSEQIRSILIRTGLKIEADVADDLLSKLQSRFDQKRAYPYQIASCLRKKLIQRGLPIIDPYDLEKAVCQEIGQPLPLIFGDLNWVDEDTEAPKHPSLIVRHHFGLGSLQFYNRFKEREVRANKNNYRNMWIFYPI